MPVTPNLRPKPSTLEAFTVLSLVFRTKIEIERLAIGDMIKIVADDPESEEDISMWAKRNGHELLSVNKDNKDLEFLIKKAK